MIILLLIFIGGLILGIMFGYSIIRDVYIGPNSKDIYYTKFYKDNKCYQLIPKEEECNLLDEHI
jgi:hypothetical protein